MEYIDIYEKFSPTKKHKNLRQFVIILLFLERKKKKKQIKLKSEW